MRAGAAAPQATLSATLGGGMSMLASRGTHCVLSQIAGGALVHV
jgi:hypothetical protein